LSRWAASQLSARCTDVVKVHQELPIRIELAHGPEPLHHVIGLDRMNQHALEAAVRSPSSCSMGGWTIFKNRFATNLIYNMAALSALLQQAASQSCA
jgi:hypothetical protein